MNNVKIYLQHATFPKVFDNIPASTEWSLFIQCGHTIDSIEIGDKQALELIASFKLIKGPEAISKETQIVTIPYRFPSNLHNQ